MVKMDIQEWVAEALAALFWFRIVMGG